MEFVDRCAVSIIIPCYNCGLLLEETLDSLCRQTYRDFEIICINDGSTDNTSEILKRWQTNNAFNLRVINQENGGVSKARNVGISKSKGKYIVFCDADDLYHERYIEILVNAMESSGADTAYCLLSRSHEDVFHSKCSAKYEIESQDEAMSRLMYKMGMIAFCCYIYKRCTLLEEKILFDENTRNGEDREFNWKYLCHCHKVAFVNSKLYWYRINKSSASHKKMTWRTDSLDAVKRTEAYLELNNCEFSEKYNSYMFARVIWGLARKYAISKEPLLFAKLCREYNVRKHMQRTFRDKNRLVAIASGIFLINPKLFYYIFRFIGE